MRELPFGFASPAPRRTAAAKTAAASARPAAASTAGPAATAITTAASPAAATAAQEKGQQPPAAEDAAQGNEDENDHDQEDQRIALPLSVTRLRRRRGALLRLRRIQRQLLDQGIGPRLNPAVEIAGAEFGQYLSLDDHAGKGIGHDGFQPITDLDPHLVLGGRDDQKNAIVQLGLAD